MVYFTEAVRNLCSGAYAEIFRIMPPAGKLETVTRVVASAAAAGIIGGCVVGRKTAITAMVAGGLGAFAYFTSNYGPTDWLGDTARGFFRK